MTPTEYAQELELKIAELQGFNKPFRTAVYSAIGKASRRIFVSGINEKGQSFQYNSTDQMYVPNPDNPKSDKAWIQARQKSVMTGKGKYGESTFKTGKKKGQKHVTTYFESYKEFRALQGLESNFVVWKYNNDLMSDYLNAKDVSNASPVEISANEYRQELAREINVKKYEGLSERYGKFLTLQPSEIKYLLEINEKELNLFLSK